MVGFIDTDHKKLVINERLDTLYGEGGDAEGGEILLSA